MDSCFFLCLCEALCVIQDAGYYITVNDERVICQRLNTNLIPPENGTDEMLCVSLHRGLY